MYDDKYRQAHEIRHQNVIQIFLQEAFIILYWVKLVEGQQEKRRKERFEELLREKIQKQAITEWA